MGRPTKLTPQVQETVVQAIRAGNYGEVAARAAGIAPSTFYRYLTRGEEEPDSIYAAFTAAVRLAEAQAEVHAVAVLRRGMSSDWRAAVVYLERRHPSRWRRQTSTEVSGPGGGPIRSEQQLDLSQLSDEELALVQRIYTRVADREGGEETE